MKYVVDGTNIICLVKDSPSLTTLLALLVEIRKNGDDFYCIFDANTAYKHLNNENDKSIFNDLVRKHSSHFKIVTGGTLADDSVLGYADAYNLRVISNDRYKDYSSHYDWLKDRYTDRLIKVNVHDERLFIISGLPYENFENTKNSQSLILELEQLLNISSHPEELPIDNRLNNHEYDSDILEEIYDELDKALRQIVEDHDKKLLDLKNYYRDELRKISGMNSKLENRLSSMEQKNTTLEGKVAKLENRLSSMEQKNTTLEGKVFKLENKVKNGFKEIKKESTSYSESKRESTKTSNSYTLGEYERTRGYESLYGAARNISNNSQKSVITDGERIKKVQKEIDEFMDAYGGYKGMISFRGSSWTAAMNGLRAYFERQKLCTNCYQTNSVYRDDCMYCRKKTLTSHPKDIWGIVMRNSP